MMTCRIRLTLVLWLGSGASLSIESPVHAQAEDQAAARALFNSGRSLITAGDYKSGCPKIEAANKLYKSAGILLNLADCQEHFGQTASAWATFGEAASVATRTNRDADAAEAKRRQTVLESKLVRLTVNVSKPVAGLVIERDGVTLHEAALGTPLPVDPGRHELVATASGYRDWTRTVEVSEPGKTVTVEVPALKPIANEPVPTTARPSKETVTTDGREKESRLLEWSLIGGGATLAAAGGVLMLVESKRADTARDEDDLNAYDSTKTPWALGLVGVVLGAASAGTGVFLLATTDKEAPSTALRVSPFVGPSGASLVVQGGFR